MIWYHKFTKNARVFLNDFNNFSQSKFLQIGSISIFLFATAFLGNIGYNFTKYYKIRRKNNYVNLYFFKSQIIQFLCKPVDNLCFNFKIRLVFVDNSVDMWINCAVLFKFYIYISNILTKKLCNLKKIFLQINF